MTDEERTRIDRLRGRCTGLPACCIEFFVTTWQAWFRGCTPEFHAYSEAFAALHQQGKGIGYVPCPACFEAKAFVRPKHCHRGCLCDNAIDVRRMRALSRPTIDEHW